jgi:hypothetical protein
LLVDLPDFFQAHLRDFQASFGVSNSESRLPSKHPENRRPDSVDTLSSSLGNQEQKYGKELLSWAVILCAIHDNEILYTLAMLGQLFLPAYLLEMAFWEAAEKLRERSAIMD